MKDPKIQPAPASLGLAGGEYDLDPATLAWGQAVASSGAVW